MKKSKIFLGIGCIMTVIAVVFVGYALNHPEASFPWSSNITHTIYKVYLIITIAMFALSIITRKK